MAYSTTDSNQAFKDWLSADANRKLADKTFQTNTTTTVPNSSLSKSPYITDPLNNLRNIFTTNSQGSQANTSVPATNSSVPTNNTSNVYNPNNDPMAQAIKNNPNYKPAETPTITPEKPVESPEMQKLREIISGQDDKIKKIQEDNQATVNQYQTAIDNAKQAKLAQIRAAISNARGKFQTTIDNAPQEFQTKRNEVAGQSDLNQLKLRRALGNMGYTPTDNLFAIQQGNANNSANQQINDLDIAQKKTIQDAQNAIAQLEADGAFQQASAVDDYAMKKLDALTSLKQQLYQNITNADNTYKNDLKGLIDFQTARKDKADEVTRQNTLLDMQKRQADAELTGIDPITGKPTFAKTSADNVYDLQRKTFDYNKTKDDREFNYNLNKDLGYVNPTANITVPDNIRQALAPYASNYAQAYKDLLPTNPTLAKFAQVLSNEKMFSDPNLLKQYGSQFQTLQNQQIQSGLQTDAMQRIGLNLDNMIKSEEYKSLPELTKYKLQLAKAQAKAGDLENAKAEIVNLNLPKEYEIKFQKELADIAQGWSQIGIQQQNANTSAGNLALNQQEFNAKKAAGAYDPEMYNLDKQIKQDSLSSKKLNDITDRLDKMFVTKFFDKNTLTEIPKVVGDPTVMRTNILNLKLPDDQTDYLLSRYNLPIK